ncbi:Gibberellin 2-beta-dioxygenase 1 [Acorus calamus]|uniref:gibberellin 2beta-dioxygenase n=1 Tax=Acorus calamus TaxID=4465 RepID=A0AAV9FCS2_ACOCL|nr:Gibberellin 2-beta-dioxygenase 1 [Acorus calamus]
MVVLAKPAPLEQISIIKTHTSNNFFTGVPVIDLSRPDSKATMIKACMELGFFKVINHGIPTGLVSRLEAEAVKFFSLSQVEKERDSGIRSLFGYGSKRIGSNGDVGWLEYLLMQTNRESLSRTSQALFRANPDAFRSAVSEYLSAVKKLACEVLEMMAEGLNIQPKNVFSKLLMDEESDSLFRLNHYPPCPQLQEVDCKLTGFGEHTDPQIISILRSNNTSGLQISLRDGSWVSVPSDQKSFFINVGDSLQVLTNGRFRSVRHRVLANSYKSRVSMIYFGGPPQRERLAPLPLLMGEGEESLYKEFTWFEYKTSAYKTRLADNRLGQFMK